MTDDSFLQEPELPKNTAEVLDHSPLKFGKFKGKTPDRVAKHEHNGEQYLVWAYETVGNFDVCSELLYKECGGRGARAVGNRKPPAPSTPDTYESTAHAKDKSGSSWDEDDDIPF